MNTNKSYIAIVTRIITERIVVDGVRSYTFDKESKTAYFTAGIPDGVEEYLSNIEYKTFDNVSDVQLCDIVPPDITIEEPKP